MTTEPTAKPTLVLFAGSRSVRLADICNPLATLADVVLVTSEDILAARGDRLDDSGAAP